MDGRCLLGVASSRGEEVEVVGKLSFITHIVINARGEAEFG